MGVENGELTKNRWSNEIQPQGRLWIIKGRAPLYFKGTLVSTCRFSLPGTGKTLFSSMKSLLIKFYLSSRRDAYRCPPAPVVINFTKSSLKKCSFSAQKSWTAALPSPLWGGNATSSLPGNQLSSSKRPWGHHLKIIASENTKMPTSTYCHVSEQVSLLLRVTEPASCLCQWPLAPRGHFLSLPGVSVSPCLY